MPPAPLSEAPPAGASPLLAVLRSKWTAAAAGSVLLAALTFAAYRPVLDACRLWPTENSGFIWDDDDYVEKNQTLRTNKGLRDIWFKIGATPQYYPLVHTTFWLECNWLGARDPNLSSNPDRCIRPHSFHLINLILHVANALLLWAVLRRLGLRGAYAAAVLYAVHPVMVESAAWITERKNVLSLTCYLGALLAYQRFDPACRERAPGGRTAARWVRHGSSWWAVLLSFLVWAIRRSRWVAYGLSVFLFFLALCAKTVTFSLPAAILLLMWWKRGTYAQFLALPLVIPAAIAIAAILKWGFPIGWSDFLRIPDVRNANVLALLVGMVLLQAGAFYLARRRVRVLCLMPLFILAGAMSAITVWMERVHVGAEGSAWSLSLTGHALLAGRIPWFYLGKLLWPADVMFFYERWLIDPGQAWQYLYPAATLGLVAALWLLKKWIGRGPLVAVLFFGITLFPALGFISVYPMRFSYVADHFQYHAAMGMIALVVGVLAALTRLPAEPAATWRRILPVAVRGSLVALAGGFLLYAWSESGRLPPPPASRVADANIPSFAALPLRGGDLAAAAGAALAAGALAGLLAWRLPGRGAKALHLAAACLALAATASALARLTQRQTHDYENRKVLWTSTIAKNPTSWISWNNLGCLYMGEANNVGALNRTIEYFEKGVAEYDRQKALEGFPKGDPNRVYDDAILNLGIIALRKGEIDKANDCFAAGFALKPKSARMRNMVGMAFWEAKRPLDALKYFREAAEITPGDPDIQNNIGFILGTEGYRKEAIEYYGKAIALMPRHADAHFNLGMAYQQEDPNRALAEFRLAIESNPRHVKALGTIAVVYHARGQSIEALQAAQRTLAIDGDDVQALGIAASIWAAHPDPLVRNGPRALEYARRLVHLTGGADMGALDTLACAQAETGDFQAAVQTAQKAIDLALRIGRQDLAGEIRSRQQLYRAGKPFRRGGP